MATDNKARAIGMMTQQKINNLSENVYIKTEIDTMLDEKANIPSYYYGTTVTNIAEINLAHENKLCYTGHYFAGITNLGNPAAVLTGDAIKTIADSKANAINVIRDTTTTAITYNFISKNSTDSRYIANLTSIAFTFGNGAYGLDYTSAMSFSTDDTAPQVSYTDTGILNWLGTDCLLSNGKSIFTPVSNKHYDIVFYFNGIQFIGMVSGFTPAAINN